MNRTATNSGGEARPWRKEPIEDPASPENLVHGAVIQKYEVFGKTWQELAESIQTFGTRIAGAPAKTTYSLVWHSGGVDANCGLASGTASAEIAVVFPHWVAMPSNTDEALQWWRYFIRNAAQVQQSHIDQALKDAETATQEMRSAACADAQTRWIQINAGLTQAQHESDFQFTSTALPDLSQAEEFRAKTGPGNSSGAPPLSRGHDAGPGFPGPLPPGTEVFDYHMPLRNVAGQPFSLESTRGHVVVVNFWATWCGFCRSEEPSFEGLINRLNDPNIVFAFITSEQQQVVKSFLGDSHWTVPVFLTNTASAGPYQSSGLPETLIIAKTGDVAMKVPGTRNWDTPQMAEYLKSLAAASR